MATQTTTPQSSAPADSEGSRPAAAAALTAAPEDSTHVLDELLVEDVSIDGMCGVY